MARNRIIKVEFWIDETLNKLSLMANLLFIGLWNFADDYGVLLNSDRKILGEIFPFRKDIAEKDIIKWKNELISTGRLIRISVDNQEYLIIKHWSKHQTVPNPSQRRYLTDKIISQIIDIYDKKQVADEEYIDTNEGLIRVYFAKEKPAKIKPEKPAEKKIEYIDFDFKNIDDKPIKFVKLPAEDFQKLIDKTSKKYAVEMVCKLDTWYRKQGKKVHKDDYLTICQWIRKEEKEKKKGVVL